MNKTTLSAQERELLNLYGEEVNDDDYEIIEIDDSEDLDDYDLYDEELEDAIKSLKEEEPQVSMGKAKKVEKKIEDVEEKLEKVEQKLEKVEEKTEEIKPLEDFVLSYNDNDEEETTIRKSTKVYGEEELQDDEDDYSSDYDDDYDTDEEDYNIEEEHVSTTKRVIKKKRKRKGILGKVVFVLLLIVLAMFLTDFIRYKKFNKLPMFALPLVNHKDGGTKEYFGAGYKLIDYHQKNGKRGKEFGSWLLKYNAKPVVLNIKDLAIEVDKNEEKSFNKYTNKYIRVLANLKSIEKELNEITLEYDDENEKYRFDIVCKMSNKIEKIEGLEVGKDITIVGTAREFDYETGTNPSTFFLSDCFLEK